MGTNERTRFFKETPELLHKIQSSPFDIGAWNVLSSIKRYWQSVLQVVFQHYDSLSVKSDRKW